MGAAAGKYHRIAVLSELARAGPGELPGADGDLYVEGHGDDATVTMNGRTASFATLAGTRLGAPEAPDQPTAGRTEREVTA